MKKYSLLLFLFLCVFNLKSFADKFTLESSAFKANTMIPIKYTCFGANESPPLTWKNLPPKTQSLVLIVQDPNAPSGVWTHWVLFNIPPTVTKLDAATLVPNNALNSKNSWGIRDYRGPCPSFGAHSYYFKLYALDNVLNIENDPSVDVLLQAMTGHVLGSATLAGIYQK